MSTVAVVCEYNPFHNGHKYQIDKIREEFGDDTCIIAIMSGNFTQRGEIAICDKGARAKCAVLAGADIVLELPFPYSISSAEFFAAAAVHIANSLGTVDYLSFGSECGCVEELVSIAERMMSPEYADAFDKLSKSDEIVGGYPRMCELAVKAVCGDASPVDFTPNNILAIEYIKAILRSGSKMIPHTIKRAGAAFDADEISSGDLQSATAIRASVIRGDISALEYIPNITKEVILNELEIGSFPTRESALSTAVISHLRLSSSDDGADIHDASGGLYNRLRAKSFEANDIDSLIRLTETKRYTTARIRRVMWYSFFGVTSSEVRVLPAYTQLLAMSAIGRVELKRIKKANGIQILTKPSRTENLSPLAQRQKAASDRADALFQLAKPVPPHGNYSLTFTPFVKIDE